MENQKIRRFWASITMLCLVVTQFTTGVFPIPISPVQSAYAAGFFIEKERDDAPESEPVAPGDTIRYKITIRNDDNKTANARIIDPLPPELEYVSATNGCSFVPASPGRGDEVICAEQPLAVGASRNVKITFRVKSNVQQCTTIENQADVWNDDANYPTGIPPAWSNLIETPTICDDPELDIEKRIVTPSSGPVEPGDNLHYRIDVENIGTGTAYNVVVTDSIPSGLIFVSSTPGICSNSSTTVTCNLGAIDEGDTEDVILKFTVDPNIQPSDSRCGNDIVNQARANANNADQVTSNSVNTRLNCPAPDLNITKSSNKTEVTRGSNEQITFTLEVENSGNGDATNLYVTDAIPAGLTYDDGASDNRCSQSGNQVVCGAFDLNAGDDTRFQLKYNVSNTAPCGNGTITNTGYLRASSYNGGIIDTSNQVTVDVLCPVPDLDITKSVDKSQVTRGSNETLTYTVNVDNSGNGDATNLYITDSIPTGLTYNDGASDSRCDQSGNQVVCGAFDLNAGDDTNFTLKFNVNNYAVCGNDTIRNTAHLKQDSAYGTTIDTSNEVVTDVDCPVPDLDITKNVDKSEVTRGSNETLTYTLNVDNSGNGNATNLYITDTIPTGLTYNDGASDSRCNQSGNQIFCGPFNLNAGDDTNFTLKFNVNNSAYCGDNTIANTAHLKQDGTYGTTIDTSNTVYTDVLCPVGILTAEKIADHQNRDFGQQVRFTIRLRNTGNATIPDVRFTDNVPTGLHFKLAKIPSSCTYNAGNEIISCGDYDLAPGAVEDIDLYFQVTVDAPCGGSITNTATVTAPGQTTLYPQSTIQIGDCPSLDITKTGPGTVNAGDTVTYEITVRNDGSVLASNVRVYDFFLTSLLNRWEPAPFQYLSASGASCTYDNSEHRVECDIGSLNPGDEETFTLTFRTPANQYCDETIMNQADAHLNYGQGTSASDWDKHMVTINCPQPDLDITKSVNKTEVTKGTNELLMYTLTIENSGAGDATDLYISDTIPTGLTYNDGASDSRCSQNGNQVFCGAIDLDAGDDTDIVLKYTVNNYAVCGVNTIENSAYLKQGSAYGSTIDISNIVYTDVLCPIPELQIEKTGPAYATAGENVTYNFTVENTGAGDAINVYVADYFFDFIGLPLNLPLPFQYISASGANCTPDDYKVSCSLGDIGAGDSEDFSITFYVPENTPQCGKEVRNRGYVDLGPVNGNGDGYDEHRLTVRCPDAELVATKSADKTEVRFHEFVTFTINVENISVTDATDVNVVDPVPSHLMYIDSSSDALCDQVGANIECGLFNLNAGTDRDIEITFKVLDTAPCDGIIANRADAYASNAPTVWSNQVDLDVICPDPSFTAVKTASATQVSIGDTLIYDIVITNTGNVDLEGLWIFDTIPTGLSFEKTDPRTDTRCFQGGNQVRCGDTTIPVGGSDTYTLVFTVNNYAPCGDDIKNTAEILFTGNGNLGGLTNETSTDVHCDTVELDVTKTGPGNVTAGGNVTYDFNIKNNGNSTATNVFITDFFKTGPLGTLVTPAPFQYTSKTGPISCTTNVSHVYCTLDNPLASGADVDFSLTFIAPINDNCSENVYNQVDVQDGNGNTDWDDHTVYVSCPQANMNVSKTVDQPTLNGGTGQKFLEYQVIVENNGQVDLTNVQVEDAFPVGTVYVDASSDARCDQAGPNVECDAALLPIGQSTSFNIVVEVDTSALCGTTIYNDATVSNDQTASDTTNTVQTIVSDCPDAVITATKSSDKTVVEHLDFVTFTISVDNSSITDAIDVNVVDPIPAHLMYIDGSSDGICSANGGNVECGLFDLAAGDSRDIDIVFKVLDTAPCGDDQLVNRADVYASNAPTVWTNQVELDVYCPQAGISVNKIVDPSNLSGGTGVQGIDYAVEAINTGNVDLANVQVVDAIPTGLTFVAGASDARCSEVGTDIICDEALISIAGDTTFVLVFDVDTDVHCSEIISNSAVISSDNTPDATTNTVTTTISSCPTAGIEVRKSVDKTTIAGNLHLPNLEYTIEVENTGGIPLTDVVVTDQIADHLIFLPAPASDSNCSFAAGVVTCDGDDIPVGLTETFVIAFDVDVQELCGETIENYASVDTTNIIGALSNSVQTVIGDCPDPSLYLEKFANKQSVGIGEAFHYSLFVENQGLGRAHDVIVTDEIPSSLTYLP
ncbi:MAG: DUF11 domain-containing protein, partial [Candidatus Peribacter sp.]|nr:DUF11 domain-containing protein [Candidatus Peribacter sp.]